MRTYKVNEIFYSLQGEGFHTGTPAVFLRFSGCNLSCDFCDTNHQPFTLLTAQDIMSHLEQYPAQHIVITGGEPALQIDQPLVDLLHSHGYFIQIETNGTLPLPAHIDWITCSPKQEIPCVLKHIDELKIVFCGQDVEAIAQALPQPRARFLQPLSGSNTLQVIAYIKTHPHWRLSLQTHKLINIP